METAKAGLVCEVEVVGAPPAAAAAQAAVPGAKIRMVAGLGLQLELLLLLLRRSRWLPEKNVLVKF